MHTVLTIAGSDSSGGAGLAADLKTFAALGCHGALVVTAVTAQDSLGVHAWLPVPVALLRAQLDSVLVDQKPRAAKTGMLPTASIVRAVAEALAARPDIAFVCDPVLAASTGHTLTERDALAAMRDTLFPLATVITPNVPEAERLTEREIRSVEDSIDAARELIAGGARAVVVKGGHLPHEPGTDVLVSRDAVARLPAEWIPSASTHGTGCVFSAAIAAQLAGEASLEDAVRFAKRFTADSIRHGYRPGRGGAFASPR
jgi:hydroxymethylpyrimidine/phosphomethylpyrimidine kinase